MPHVAQSNRKSMLEGGKPTKVGDLCFLFANGALQEYNKAASWTTIHTICVALRSPYHTNWTHELIQQYMTNWNKTDVETAAYLAFLEFYRLVGSKYEDDKIAENGSCFALANLPEPIVEKRKPGRPKVVVNG